MHLKDSQLHALLGIPHCESKSITNKLQTILSLMAPVGQQPTTPDWEAQLSGHNTCWCTGTYMYFMKVSKAILQQLITTI